MGPEVYLELLRQIFSVVLEDLEYGAPDKQYV